MALFGEDRILSNGLTMMQELFCNEYIVDFKKQAAAIRAGYAPGSASGTAAELYKMPKIRKRIMELLRVRREEYNVTEERMQQEIARIAFADPFKIMKTLNKRKFSIKNIDDIPPSLRAAVKSVRSTKEGLHITFHEKTTALEMLAKHFGYFEADNKQKAVEGPQIYLPHNNRDALPPVAGQEGNKNE